MKKIVKLLAVVSALILASSVFTSCKDNDDDDDSSGSSSISAVFEEIDANDGYFLRNYIRTLTFTNNTFKLHVKYETSEIDFDGTKKKAIFDYDLFIGNYTGNPTKDGELKLTVLKSTELPMNKDTIIDILEAATDTTVNLSDKIPPLKDCEPETITATIKGNKLMMYASTYTRK